MTPSSKSMSTSSKKVEFRNLAPATSSGPTVGNTGHGYGHAHGLGASSTDSYDSALTPTPSGKGLRLRHAVPLPRPDDVIDHSHDDYDDDYDDEDDEEELLESHSLGLRHRKPFPNSSNNNNNNTSSSSSGHNKTNDNSIYPEQSLVTSSSSNSSSSRAVTTSESFNPQGQGQGQQSRQGQSEVRRVSHSMNRNTRQQRLEQQQWHLDLSRDVDIVNAELAAEMEAAGVFDHPPPHRQDPQPEELEGEGLMDEEAEEEDEEEEAAEGLNLNDLQPGRYLVLTVVSSL